MTRPAPHTRDSVTFTIPGPPVALQRARITARFGFARAYDPPVNKTAKTAVATAARAAMGKSKPIDGALSMIITFYLAKPKSKQRKNSDPYPHPTSRPDLDNYLKLALDGMNGIVYNDDAQVVAVDVCKKWTQDDVPYTFVSVWRET